MTEEQLQKFESLKALGIEINDRPWGALLYRPDPNGISSPGYQMVAFDPTDGKVNVWADVGEEDTPETLNAEGIECDVVRETLDEFVHNTYQTLINDELDNEDWMREDLIVFMIGQGWEKFHGSTEGTIRHANNHSLIYGSWFDAAKACIEQAVGDM